MLEPSLDLYGQTFDKVDALLKELISRSHARYALIIDMKGFVLMHARALWAPKPPSLDSLATLVASNYSANTAIARLFGETGFKEVVQQGSQVGTYLEELGSQALLITVYDRTAALGRVKLIAKKTADEIKVVLAENTEPPPLFDLGSKWSADADALLDGFFGKDKV